MNSSKVIILGFILGVNSVNLQKNILFNKYKLSKFTSYFVSGCCCSLITFSINIVIPDNTKYIFSLSLIVLNIMQLIKKIY